MILYTGRAGKSVRAILLGAISACLVIGATPAGAQNSDAVGAFNNFVLAGQYEQASFYIQNNLITADQVDSTQLFYNSFMKNFASQPAAKTAEIDALYSYLNAFEPIDLNQPVTCGYNGEFQCLFASDLMTGAPLATIGYFVERGMDLNIRVPGILPPSVPLLTRLGAVYSVADLNTLTAAGLVLGDELYPMAELASYQDSGLYNQRLTLPDNYLTMSDQNLLDVAVVALGTRLGSLNQPQQSARRKTLCEFVAYAAPSFQPSYDYLDYLLRSVEEFRGKSVGILDRAGSNVAYEPFPAACVTLIQSMAIGHAKLDTVISRFAGSGDVETAQWLISIKQQAAPAQAQATPQ